MVKAASLVKIDPAKNMDKYYILQLLSHKTQPSDFYVYTRWGRTGTGGHSQKDGPLTEDNATKSFEKKFQEKSGLAWSSRSAPPQTSFYEYMQPSDTSGPGAGNTLKCIGSSSVSIDVSSRPVTCRAQMFSASRTHPSCPCQGRGHDARWGGIPL